MPFSADPDHRRMKTAVLYGWYRKHTQAVFSPIFLFLRVFSGFSASPDLLSF
jgi:hypothetical protein